MYHLGLPAPRCVFIFDNDNVTDKINKYFNKFPESEFYTIRTDTEDTSMSCKRKLSATKKEIIELAHEWKKDFQIILQEFIDERIEIKSGNIYLLDDKIIIEGSNNKHIKFTNGLYPDVNLSLSRYDKYDISIHRFFTEQKCLSLSEVLRLIRWTRRIPYNKAVIEFSFFKDGRLYFWEIKKEDYNKRRKLND